MLLIFIIIDRDLLRAQLREMKTASQRTKKSSLLTRGTFFSQYIDKTESLSTNTQNKLAGLLKLTNGRKLNSISTTSFFSSGNPQQVRKFKQKNN